MEPLIRLFSAWSGKAPDKIEALPPTGSNRRYYRIFYTSQQTPDRPACGQTSCIGGVGTNRSENLCFTGMARHFASQGINVPEVYAVSEDGMCYIQEDLGTLTLFEAVARGRNSGNYSDEEKALLLKTIRLLPKIQYKGAEGLDFNLCFQEKELSHRQILFDLNYFKYCFLKAVHNDFHEASLQDDFDLLAADLLKDRAETFLYRDFQARNVILKDGEPYFIDFQGGMRGPVYYDLAAFVWQAKAAYPDSFRKQLVEAYMEELRKYCDIDETFFRDRLRLFVLFRTIQVLGAYGFRGYFEGKVYFTESVPYAMANLRALFADGASAGLQARYPYLCSLLRMLCVRPEYMPTDNSDRRLTVKVCSFSYRKGIPEDRSGNGGGYVFDCRAMDNPGRYEEYKKLTGLDAPVIEFLEKRGEVQKFLASAEPLADSHVERFVSRGFTNMSISFGCTGGQHRSVYCAQKMAEHLKERFGETIRVRLIHRERGIDRYL